MGSVTSKTIHEFQISSYRLIEGEKTYTVSQSFYEQNNSVSNNGSHYFMGTNCLQFIDDVSGILF